MISYTKYQLYHVTVSFRELQVFETIPHIEGFLWVEFLQFEEIPQIEGCWKKAKELQYEEITHVAG